GCFARALRGAPPPPPGSRRSAPPAMMVVVLPLVIALLALAPAAAAAPAPDVPAAPAGPLCPKDGPREGTPPPILILTPGGARLGVCADASPGQDASLVADEVSILDFRDPLAPAPVWSGDAGTNHFRVESLGQTGVRVRLELLLPRPDGPYDWVP